MCWETVEDWNLNGAAYEKAIKCHHLNLLLAVFSISLCDMFLIAGAEGLICICHIFFLIFYLSKNINLQLCLVIASR